MNSLRSLSQRFLLTMALPPQRGQVMRRVPPSPRRMIHNGSVDAKLVRSPDIMHRAIFSYVILESTAHRIQVLASGIRECFLNNYICI